MPGHHVLFSGIGQGLGILYLQVNPFLQEKLQLNTAKSYEYMNMIVR